LSGTIELPPDPLLDQQADQIIPILDKIHIRGVDNLSSADVKRYAGEHSSLDDFVRIEWIDDTSANLLYGDAHAAAEALTALTNVEGLNIATEQIPTLQLRPAKSFSTNPDSKLFVRQSTNVDVKRKGAHDASRYYLLNPEHDPRERKKFQENRRHRGKRGSDEDGDYNRRHFDDNELKRRRQDPSTAFDVNMYDEDTAAPRDGRRKRARGLREEEDLFSNRSGHSADGRLRNRSASPARDGDGMRGFDSDDNARYRSRHRRRSASPKRPAGNRNIGKELFPSGSTASTSSHVQSNVSKELFPAKVTAPSTGLRSSIELFTSKRQSFSNHRRKDAVDASGSGHAEFFASSATPPPTRERSLADRITGRPSTASDDIRIRGAADMQDMSIKGAGGMSIRGMANAGRDKDLFPLKAGNNVGKELFGDGLPGSRRKEDLFS
jgi:Nuclear cap-binding protein subunit 3